MNRVEITVSQDPAGGGAWRLFSTDAQDRGLPISQDGRVLGGTWNKALADAERLRETLGFEFVRPDGLWMPGVVTLADVE